MARAMSITQLVRGMKRSWDEVGTLLDAGEEQLAAEMARQLVAEDPNTTLAARRVLRRLAPSLAAGGYAGRVEGEEP